MERYTGLRRHDIVARIEAALRSSGAQVLTRIDPTSAPFEVAVATPTGKRLELVCYAFTANKYQQRGRPEDEHRFQVKYGSEFDRYHHLYFDRTGRKITVMFGVHLELGLFVGVDPRMHSPTWFSSSVELKAGELQAALTSGWHGWERERSDGRRKRVRPEQNLRTETVVAVRPEHFLRYIEFEQVASGLDCGERLLLSDQVERSLVGPEPLTAARGRHPLELQLGLPANDILNVISGAFRLAAAVRGGVAEHHLERQLHELPGIRHVRHISADRQPDFAIEYRRRPFLIECKKVLARPRQGRPRVDFQKTRASKADPCSRYYTAAQFQVLAACLHPITTRWEFRFAPTHDLAPHPKCAGRLASNVTVETTWPSDLRVVLDRLCDA